MYCDHCRKMVQPIATQGVVGMAWAKFFRCEECWSFIGSEVPAKQTSDDTQGDKA